MSKATEPRAVAKDPHPERIKTIADITFEQPKGDPWLALYYENEAAVTYRAITAWCAGINAAGRRIGQSDDDDTFTSFGLVIVDNRLEVCDTHPTFVAYVQNPDARLIRDLVAEWLMANQKPTTPPKPPTRLPGNP